MFAAVEFPPIENIVEWPAWFADGSIFAFNKIAFISMFAFIFPVIVFLVAGSKYKTRLVPKGRGPFSTWEEAAIDALKIKRYPPEWDIAHIAYAFEKFNGFGYRSKGIPSPYLWGGSNIQRPGKYVRDGVYDASCWLRS